MSKKFLSTGDIANYCEVNITTVKRWIKENHLKGFQTPMGHFKVAKDEFLTFLKANNMPIDAEFFGDEGKKALIIDDDKGLIKTLKMAIETGLKDVSVEAVHDGYEGLMKIGQEMPDLIIIDLNMPKIDGYEVIKRVQENKELAAAKILVISAFLDENAIERLDEMEIKNRLQKPFKLSVFRQEVKQLLGNNVQNER